MPPGCYTLPALSYAPRFGFAWDPFARTRTRVHGGVGVYFDRIMGNPTMGLMANPPTIYSPTVYYGTLDDAGRHGRPGHPRPQQRHLAVRPGKVAHGV